MVREIATTSNGYPVVAVQGTTCLARLRGKDRVIAAYDLSSGDVLWTFDVGVNGLAAQARGAANGDGSFFLPRAKRRRLEICRVSPAGKVEVVDDDVGYGNITRPVFLEDVREDKGPTVAHLLASSAGVHAVRMDRATWTSGQRLSGEALGWVDDTLVVVGTSRFDATALDGHRGGRSVWYAGIQAYERPVIAGDQVLLVRPFDAPRVRALSAATGTTRWTWDAPFPISRWLATPFAMLLVLADTTGAALATLLPDGTLASPPAALGPRNADVDVVAAEPSRLLWLSQKRLVCAPLAEPGASVWEATLPPDLTAHYACTKGVEPQSEPPVIVCDAGVLVVCDRRVVLLA